MFDDNDYTRLQRIIKLTKKEATVVQLQILPECLVAFGLEQAARAQGQASEFKWSPLSPGSLGVYVTAGFSRITTLLSSESFNKSWQMQGIDDSC